MPPVTQTLCVIGSEMKTTVHMLCGFICSGKTSFARKLEKDVEGVIFSIDQWMSELFGNDRSDEIVMKYGPRIVA